MQAIRQLAAIMFTDIVGYTALMGKDEQKAIGFLTENRRIQKPIIEQCNGRWIKELGDGVLASFPTVSDAVKAAITIQQACNSAKWFQLRIGIHLGEVMFENDDVFGDGVNIASRIQAIAHPGSIFISEAVHNNIANKTAFHTAFLKEVKLKNITEPVRIYQVIAKDVVTTSPPVSRKLKPSPKVFIPVTVILILAVGYWFLKNLPQGTVAINEKSIAVLPFADLSPAKDQEYLADGLAEEIINSITIIKGLKVIGRTSSFQYKGKGLDARTIGQRLNVNNVLEGSVQKSGNVLRIITKLIGVKNDSTIWSQRFDKEMKDIFAVQDSIAKNIVEKLSITLSESERPRLIKKQTHPDVYSLYLKGLYTYKKEDFKQSLAYHLQAVAIDSLFAPSHAYIALSKTWLIARSNATADYKAIREAKAYANKAIRLDPDLAEGYSALGLMAWLIELDFASAKINFEKSLQRTPASLVKNRYAYFLLWMGKFDKAEKLALEAISSDPADYNGYFLVANANMYKKNFAVAEYYIAEGQNLFPDNPSFPHLGISLKFYAGSYEAVIQTIKPAVLQNANSVREGQLGFLSIAYFKKGALEESRKILRLLQQRTPNKTSSIDYSLARIFAQYKQPDSCFLHLEKAFEKREPDFKLLKIDPLFAGLQKDQRYRQLYQRYGFASYK